LRQQQQSQIAPQGSASGAQHSNASTVGAFQPWQQQQQQPQVNVFQQMQSALAALNPSATASGSTPESSAMYHMASAMATAMMTPFLQILEQQQERQQERQQEERRLMLAQMQRMDRRLQ